jgi:hypothetical protein
MPAAAQPNTTRHPLSAQSIELELAAIRDLLSIVIRKVDANARAIESIAATLDAGTAEFDEVPLRAAYEYFGDSKFTSAELLSSSIDDADLGAALATIPVRALEKGAENRLGAYLRDRAKENAVYGNLRLIRVKKSRKGSAIWRIVPDIRSATPSTSDVEVADTDFTSASRADREES